MSKGAGLITTTRNLTTSDRSIRDTGRISINRFNQVFVDVSANFPPELSRVKEHFV